MKTAIIGAGVSGVSLAYLLSAKGVKDVTVIDRGQEAGGCIHTVKKDGFLMESGPNGVLMSRTHVKDMLTQGGMADIIQLSSTLTKRRYIQMGRKLHLAPLGPVSALKTPLLSFRGKLRILKEPFTPPKTNDDDESVLSFASRRIGAEAAENLVATLVHGVYAGDASKISAKAGFPKLYNLERDYGSLVKGMFGRMKAAKNLPASERHPRDKNSYKLMSTHDGMHGLVKRIETACNNVRFRYSTTVERMVKDKDGGYLLTINGAEEHFDNIALCCNAKDAARLLRDVAPEVAGAFDKVVFAPMFMCGMGFSRKDIAHPLDGFGFLVAPKDTGVTLGCLFSSSLFEGRAPEGDVFLTAITVGDRNRQYFSMSDSELEAKIYDELKDVLGINAKPKITLTHRTEYAIPQYYLGHSEIVKIAEEAMQKNKGLFIGGNTMHGISVADCIAQSNTLANMIL